MIQPTALCQLAHLDWPPMRALSVHLLVLCSSLIACRDALAPSGFVGYYPLRAVNEDSLPGVVPSLPAGCTIGFQYGSMFLADGAFSIYLYTAEACPGMSTGVGSREFGGGLSVQGESLRLHAVDPTSPYGATFDATIVIDGSDALLTLPPGALTVAASTSLRFGPRRPDALTPCGLTPRCS